MVFWEVIFTELTRCISRVYVERNPDIRRFKPSALAR